MRPHAVLDDARSSFSTPSSFGMRVKNLYSALCATEPRSFASTSASIVFGSRNRSTNHADEQSAKRSSSVTLNVVCEPSCSSTSGCVSRVGPAERAERALEPPLPAVRAGERLGRPPSRDAELGERAQPLALGRRVLERPRQRRERPPARPAAHVLARRRAPATSSQNGLGSRGLPSSVAASRTR